MSLHHKDIKIATERQGQSEKTVAMKPAPPKKKIPESLPQVNKTEIKPSESNKSIQLVVK